MSIISLDQAKAQLRLNDDYSDTELTGMVDAASDIVANYLQWGDTPPYDGTDKPYPPRIQTATLLVLASLYEDREGANDPIGPAVVSILRRDRDPALA
jgi:hypothetical protein